MYLFPPTDMDFPPLGASTGKKQVLNSQRKAKLILPAIEKVCEHSVLARTSGSWDPSWQGTQGGLLHRHPGNSREYYSLLGPQAPPPKCPCQQLAPVKPPSCSPKPPSPQAPHTAPPNPLQPGLRGVCGTRNTPRPRIVSPDPPQQSGKARPLPCGLGCHCQSVDQIQCEVPPNVLPRPKFWKEWVLKDLDVKDVKRTKAKKQRKKVQERKRIHFQKRPPSQWKPMGRLLGGLGGITPLPPAKSQAPEQNAPAQEEVPAAQQVPPVQEQAPVVQQQLPLAQASQVRCVSLNCQYCGIHLRSIRAKKNHARECKASSASLPGEPLLPQSLAPFLPPLLQPEPFPLQREPPLLHQEPPLLQQEPPLLQAPVPSPPEESSVPSLLECVSPGPRPQFSPLPLPGSSPVGEVGAQCTAQGNATFGQIYLDPPMTCETLLSMAALKLDPTLSKGAAVSDIISFVKFYFPNLNSAESDMMKKVRRYWSGLAHDDMIRVKPSKQAKLLQQLSKICSDHSPELQSSLLAANLLSQVLPDPKASVKIRYREDYQPAFFFPDIVDMQMYHDTSLVCQDGILDTARVLLYLCLPEYETILVGREGLRMAVFLPDYTVDEVHSQLVAATGGGIIPSDRIRSQESKRLKEFGGIKV